MEQLKELAATANDQKIIDRFELSEIVKNINFVLVEIRDLHGDIAGLKFDQKQNKKQIDRLVAELEKTKKFLNYKQARIEQLETKQGDWK